MKMSKSPFVPQSFRFFCPRGLSNFKAVLFSALLGSAPMVRAEVWLPSIFGDNMVLQQGIEVPIWGKANPLETVTVMAAEQTVSTAADADGKWRVKLKRLKTDGNPIAVTVTGKNTITLKNVLVGEVWVGSGQSNMEYPMRNALNSMQEIASAKYPKLRLFAVKSFGWAQPLDDVGGKWVECSPETVREFSCTLYFFGRDLQKQINQPIGLIHASRGGTVIESWSRWETLLTDPETKKQVEARVKQLDDPEWLARKYAENTTKCVQAFEKAKAQGFSASMGKPEWIGLDYCNRPAGLFNALIHPLLGYGIRGVVWYQAEFNNGRHEQYARLFPKMIQDWRAQWAQGDFPFLFVQLPGNEALQTEPYDATKRSKKWAELREAQTKGLDMPNTGMAVTIETAPDGDLHPKNKQAVGDRLARIAASMVYGKPVVSQGPRFESMSKQGNTVRLKFSHAEGGIVTKEGAPAQGFAIAGADRKFVWGNAKIEGDTVVVSSAEIAEPVAVRYGWADNPLVSLYNKAGLPAAPFRTDDWK